MSVHAGVKENAFRAALSRSPAVAGQAARVTGFTGAVRVLLYCAVLGVECLAQAAGGDVRSGVQVQPGAAQDGARSFEALAHQGEWGRVGELARATLASQPADTTSLYWLGAAQFQLGDTIGALRTLRAAQALGLTSAQIHLELGQVYYKLNQFVLFEQQMEQALHLPPQDGTAQYLLGFYRLSVRSDVGGALALLRQAADLRPDDVKTLYELGYCLELSGASAEAKDLYLRAIGLAASSRHPFGWPYQGLARLLLNDDPHRAVQFAADAVRLEPEEASNHLVLAKSYERLGDIPEAVKEAREAARRDPATASIRYLLFRLYRRQGELAQADRELKVYHEIDTIYGPE